MERTGAINHAAAGRMMINVRNTSLVGRKGAPILCYGSKLQKLGKNLGRSLSLQGRKAELRPLTACHALAERTVKIPEPNGSAGHDIQKDVPTPLRKRLESLLAEFKAIENSKDRVMRLVEYSSLLKPLPDSERTMANRVMGCTLQVWITASLGPDGRVCLGADSESVITRGFCSCLVRAMNDASPEEVLDVKTEDLATINVGIASGAMSRINTWHNILISMQKRIRGILAKKAGTVADPFPSLFITADGVSAQGTFAKAQAKYLSPDMSRVDELVTVLKEKKIGIVAHFYMDPEVQGVLVAAKQQWPHIHISDSLVMADKAVKMVESGCKTIMVLGVDFMSENVRAILDQAGFEKVGVYRMASEKIGCSLAEAATGPQYVDFLKAAAKAQPSLHVVYINTSLQTKAQSHQLVPTITCTSSNVVQTVLQAFAEIPDLKVWYGPDSYMGANLVELFNQMLSISDAEIAEIHPLHNRSTIKSLLNRLHYFQDGQCIVHHMFGKNVVRRVQEDYCDAFLTAHFEVPGEMFALAMDAKKRGMGVVGSTQNILDFIVKHVQEAIKRDIDEHLQFVLGTESGMVTSIASSVRNTLVTGRSNGGKANIAVEIVFPVSSDSIKEAPAAEIGEGIRQLSIVPGPAAGEGCSLHGGCASCPYMKMNTLNSLSRVCNLIGTSKETSISGHEASKFDGNMLAGQSIAELGCEPILHMRHFQSTGRLPQNLVDHIQGMKDLQSE